MPTRPPTNGTLLPTMRRPLAGDALEQVGGDLRRDDGSSWRSCTGAVAIAIGGAGSLCLRTELLDLVLAEDRHQDGVAHPRVGEVVAAQVGDGGDHPALQQRDAGDVGRHGDRHGHQAAEVGGEALQAGPAHVVLDHLVDRPVDVAVLLGELLLGRGRGPRQRPDAVEGAGERLAHEPGRQPGRGLGEPGREDRSRRVPRIRTAERDRRPRQILRRRT